MYYQLPGGFRVPFRQSCGHRITQQPAASRHRQQPARLVHHDQELVFVHDGRFAVCDGGSAEQRRGIGRQTAQHVRENRRTLSLASRIERAGPTIPGARRRAPPELSQRQRTQTLRVRVRQQLRRRTISGAAGWLPGGEQIAQGTPLAQGIGEAIRGLNGWQ